MPVKIKRSQVGRNGSGILQYFYLDRPLTLYNVVLLMIIESDNVATNVVIDLLSKEAINKYIKDIGLKNTKLLMNKLDFADDYTFKKGMLAETSASDMGIFLEKLIQGELLNEGYTKMSLNILEHTQNSNFKKLIDINKFKKYGNKTGSMWDEKEKRIILNDCGFVFGKKGQRCIFSVFSEGPGDSQIPYSNFSKSRVEFAKVSKSIFDELNKT
jgi:beta-lactamase class A